ncbi:MAG: formate dehydrogenase accessory sulfurtransferase FdhD [Nitrospirae bacterium]|nr:formate dehydrogenase accessory sulfurtransferase FdhD [Nitrospirota bacterium]
METPSHKDRRITRITGALRETVTDPVAVETMFTLFVNQVEAATVLCSPSLVRELAVGFLLGEGILAERRDLLSVRHERGRGIVRVRVAASVDLSPFSGARKGTLTTGCAKGQTYAFVRDVAGMAPLPFGTVLPAAAIARAVKAFSHMSETYQSTGGVHSAMLWDGNGLQVFAEDLGRHNAVDKVFGQCFLKGIDPQGKVLLSSGRMSSEIVLKCARAGVPLIASRNAPTSFSVALADVLDMTLVGFVRGERMNVYTHPRRVL